MRRIFSTLLAVVITAAVCWSGAASASAEASATATGTVAAQRGPSGEYGGPFELRFQAGSGSTKAAQGTFTYREPGGYTVTGRVTCYHQEGNRAVFSGPVTHEANPDNDTKSFVVWVADNDAALGGKDAFDVAGGALLGPGCAQNFPLDRFDNPSVQQSLYYVTRGAITVQ